MTLKAKMQEKKISGVLLKVACHPATILIAKDVGMDFILYDCEHGAMSYEKLLDLMVLGNQAGIPSIVRVPELARGHVSKALDCGAHGIMVPMIETAEDAKKLVEWSKYPPIGKRSYSGGANTDYRSSGGHVASNMKEVNERTLSLVQIETVEGVNNVEEILSVDGIDGAVIGPCDLSISLDIPDNEMDERELTSIKKVAQVCKDHNKFFGMFGSIKLLRHFKEELDLIIAAIDANLLRDALKASVQASEQL